MTTPGIVAQFRPRSAIRSAGIGLLPVLGILAGLTAVILIGLYVNDRFQTLEERISVNLEYLHAEREELKRLSSRLLGLSGDSQRLEGELEKEDQKLRNAVRSSFQQARKRIEESRGDIEKLSAALEALAGTVEQLSQSHLDAVDQSQARDTETGRARRPTGWTLKTSGPECRGSKANWDPIWNGSTAWARRWRDWPPRCSRSKKPGRVPWFRWNPTCRPCRNGSAWLSTTFGPA